MRAIVIFGALLASAFAERLVFASTIMPSKQQCFLEAMQDKMTGKPQFELTFVHSEVHDYG